MNTQHSRRAFLRGLRPRTLGHDARRLFADASRAVHLTMADRTASNASRRWGDEGETCMLDPDAKRPVEALSAVHGPPARKERLSARARS